MGNEEYKEILKELYKTLRDKISLSLGEYLNAEQKEKLFSFDTDNIVFDKELSKIVKYSFDDDKIHVSDEFLTPEYVEKTKQKYPEFNIEDLRNRVLAQNPKILLEELIVFSKELKIQEKDIIKSLFIQQILKMLLIREDMLPKEEVVTTGLIELVAHTIGNQNSFIVATPKKYIGELEVAVSLKNELEDKFESTVLGGNILDYLSTMENRGLITKIEELANNRKIIESTQNLNNVIDSVAKMTAETETEIKKEEASVKQEPVVEATKKEEVVSIPETNKPVEAPVAPAPQNKVNTSKPGVFGNNTLLYIGILILVVAFGILVGWLLFKFK